MFVLFLQTFVEPIKCFLLLRLCPQKPRKLIQDSRFEIRDLKYEIRNMSPRGTVPISGMIEEQMDKCLIWNQSDFLEQPLVIILVLKT